MLETINGREVDLNYERLTSALRDMPFINEPDETVISGLWAKLVIAYSEPWRWYHSINHMEAVQDYLDTMDGVSTAARIGMAFHDVVWLPGYSMNEERSAEFARMWLGELTVKNYFIDEVCRLIMATKVENLSNKPVDLAEAQCRDADLASLAEPDEQKFLATQALVWREFADIVSEHDYLAAREKLFKEHIVVPQIFWTDEYKGKEGTALNNLELVDIYV